MIAIDSVNCGIFRHGYDMVTKRPIDPHATLSDIKKLITQGRLIGCGAAFSVVDGVAAVCNYNVQNASLVDRVPN